MSGLRQTGILETVLWVWRAGKGGTVQVVDDLKFPSKQGLGATEWLEGSLEVLP